MWDQWYTDDWFDWLSDQEQLEIHWEILDQWIPSETSQLKLSDVVQIKRNKCNRCDGYSITPICWYCEEEAAEEEKEIMHMYNIMS